MSDAIRKLLLRQLRRTIAIADEAELAALLASPVDGRNPSWQALAGGMSDFLERVSGSYEQYERDLALRTRSLEISSAELTAANDKLRHELMQREAAIRSLRQLISELLPRHGESAESSEPASDDIAVLSRRIGELVHDSEASRRALANQKFALDQHAIVSMTDAQGNITYANDKFCAISGYTRAELIGRNHRIVKSALHPPSFFRDMWACIAEGEVWHGEICNRARDGHLYWVSATIVPLLDEHGLPEQYIGIRTDITDRKAAEAVVLQAKEAAESASRAKSDFLANMSHEIRTPMNGIIGMTDLALDTDLTAEQREYLGIVKSSAEALLTIINDILDFSKIEAGKLLVEEIPFNLHRLLGETVKSLALNAHEKNLELICEIPPEIPRHLLGDPGRIRQVLINLIGNAIKFTDRGEIAVHAALLASRESIAEIRISVRDTGIGISPEKQELIFESFTQEDTSTTRRYGGTGLGLSICRRLVELMGGAISLESQAGFGSIFHFVIPLHIDPQPQPEEETSLDLAGHRLLIVDDNATNRHVLGGLLAAWQIDVDYTESGPAALALMRQPGRHFDAIILDAQMPDMDGYELARRLQQEHEQLPPMMMLSSSAMRGDAQRCREAGIAAYFSKPISGEELHSALGLLLAGQGATTCQRPSINRHALRERQRPLDILLVEDHPINQKLACGLLTKWGHRVTLAANGHEALTHFAERRFDLILMDLQMPVMGGLEATRRIRESELQQQLPSTPIIAMTAAAMDEDRTACLAAGMDDYVSKPMHIAEVLEKLAAIGGSEPAAARLAGFDYRAALQRADQETIAIVAGVFLDTWERDIDRLRTAITADDPHLAERTAHSFRGSLACFSAEPAVSLAASLENRARQGELLQLNDEIDALEREIRTLAEHLAPLAISNSG
jgi:PAS domain S-box-containing protein